MKGIIDNVEVKLEKVLKDGLRTPALRRFRVAVGYFLISGLKAVLPELKDFIDRGGKVHILMGNCVNRETAEQLIYAYKDVDFANSQRKVVLSQDERMRVEESTEDDLAKQLLYIHPDEENESFLTFLTEAIRDGKIEIRIYPQERFHAKTYVLEAQESDSPITPELAGIIGSSNFTLSGLTSNTELNAVVYVHDAKALSDWYEDRWKDSADFSGNLLKVFDHSWISYAPGNFPPPYHVYLKAVYELYKEALKTTEEILRTYQVYGDLYEFQKWAVLRAVDIATKYGGVMVSDVTGMGKTFIGAALLEHFYHRNVALGKRGKALIVCPPKLQPTWQKVVSKYSLNASVLSAGLLTKKDYYRTLLEKYPNTNVVLVDESHHFRNSNINRYKNLAHFLPLTNEVLLLTATPYARGATDIYNQLKLFHPEDLTSIPITPPNLKDFTKMVERGEASLTELLLHMMVRRTRYDILSQYGKTDKQGKQYLEIGEDRYYLPERRLSTLRYGIERVYQERHGRADFYHHIVDTLENLTYARYSLGSDRYLKPGYRDKKKYQNLSRVGENIRGLMKTLLLKRLESSIYAFHETLQRTINSHRNFYKMLERGKIAAGEGIDEIVREEEEFTRIEEVVEALIEAGKAARYEPQAFDMNQLKKDIKSDLKKLEPMLEVVSNIVADIKKNYEEDDKLRNLAEHIEKIRAGSLKGMKDPAQKILVFSQFADTVENIYTGLKKLQEERKLESGLRIERVTSASGNAEEIAERFAPRANQALHKYNEAQMIDVLVATDVMGEGLNLQDANAVVNYDIHWNPLKLIQRIGRVDRLGTEHSYIYVFNFLPETSLEKELHITDVVERRVNEISGVLGSDGRILKEDEQLNPSFMQNVYLEDVGSLEEAEQQYLLGQDTVSRTVTELREKLRRDPSLLDKLERWDGIRSAKKWNHPYEAVFLICRSGKYTTPYLVAFDGEKARIRDRSQEAVLREVHCSEDEKPASVDPDLFRKRYSTASQLALREFRKELQQREKLGRPRRHAAKTYVMNELRKYHRRETDEQSRKMLSQYIDIVDGTDVSPAIDDFKRLKDNNKSGQELVEAIKEIIENYGLEEKVQRREELRDSLNEKPHIVCGMHLVP